MVLKASASCFVQDAIAINLLAAARSWASSVTVVFGTYGPEGLGRVSTPERMSAAPSVQIFALI